MLLNLLDEYDKAHADVDWLKRSLIAAGADYTALFPEFVPPPKEDPTTPLDEHTDVDYSAVEWKSPSEDPESFEKLMALINQNSTGVLTGDDFVPGNPPVTWTEWR